MSEFEEQLRTIRDERVRQEALRRQEREQILIVRKERDAERKQRVLDEREKVVNESVAAVKDMIEDLLTAVGRATWNSEVEITLSLNTSDIFWQHKGQTSGYPESLATWEVHQRGDRIQYHLVELVTTDDGLVFRVPGRSKDFKSSRYHYHDRSLVDDQLDVRFHSVGGELYRHSALYSDVPEGKMTSDLSEGELRSLLIDEFNIGSHSRFSESSELNKDYHYHPLELAHSDFDW